MTVENSNNSTKPKRNLITKSTGKFRLSNRFFFLGLIAVIILFAFTWSSARLANQDDLINFSSYMPSANWDYLINCSPQPQYKQYLKKVVVSLGAKDNTLDNHHDLLERFPDYSEIIMLMPSRNQKFIEKELQDKSYGNRVRIIAFDAQEQKDYSVYIVFPDNDKLVQFNMGDYLGSKQPGTVWAQDLFVVTKKPDGRTVLLASEVHKYYCSIGDIENMKVQRDNVYLEKLAYANMDVLNLPLVFQGGNIFFDEIDGRRIVFCGGDIINKTRTVWRGLIGKDISSDQISRLIKRVFKADKVVILSIDAEKRLQPSYMFHLDQAMILLNGKVAGVAHIVGAHLVEMDDEQKKELKYVQMFLSHVRTILLELGYEIFDIDITVNNLFNYQHYVNAIPYLDAKTGRKTLLISVFPDQNSDIDKKIEARNIAIFEELGYKVIPVPTKVNEIYGGIHCLVNVIE